MQAVRVSPKNHRVIGRFYEVNQPRVGTMVLAYHTDFWRWILSSDLFRVGAILVDDKIVAIGVGMVNWNHLLLYLPHRHFKEDALKFHSRAYELLYRAVGVLPEAERKMSIVEDPEDPTKIFHVPCTIRVESFLVPIDNEKLVRLGLMMPGEPLMVPPLENKLSLMKNTDIPIVKRLLEDVSRQYDMYPVVSLEFVRELLPKKHIVYSFVARNHLDEPTDMISIHECHIIDHNSGSIIRTAILGPFSSSTTDPTLLIKMLVDKLYHYGFAQLMIKDFVGNRVFDIDRFHTSIETTYDLHTFNCVTWIF